MADLFPAFRELRDKIASINQNVLINTILKRPEYQEFIINRITQDQLYDLNVDSLGVELASNRGGYADLTLRYAAEGIGGYTEPKRGRGRVDLHATGAYYKSHKVNVKSLKADYFELYSDTKKDETDLIEEWGPILGLTDDNMRDLRFFILEAFTPLFMEFLYE